MHFHPLPQPSTICRTGQGQVGWNGTGTCKDPQRVPAVGTLGLGGGFIKFLKFINYVWVFFFAACGLCLLVTSRAYSLWWLLLLWSPGPGVRTCFNSCGSRFNSWVHGLSCSATCGIFPDQGSNLCPLHWQVDSASLDQQGGPWRGWDGGAGFKLQLRASWLLQRDLSPSWPACQGSNLGQRGWNSRPAGPDAGLDPWQAED